MKKTDKRRPGIALAVIGAVVLLLLIFGMGVSALGYIGFTDAYDREYAETSYHIANTATALVNGDHIYDYQTGEYVEEYYRTKETLDAYCEKMSISLVYVIRVDVSDYGRFVSIFNSVNNAVDNTSYTEWELGYRRDTTNEEYSRKYRALYEQTSEYETVFRKKVSNGVHPHITTMVPVKGEDGATKAILCIQRPMREVDDVRHTYARRALILTALLAAVTCILWLLYIRKQVIRPIQRTAAEATRFAKENTKGEPLGQISRLREIDDLAGSIDTMETDMLNYIGNLTAVTAEKERIGAELSLAKTIQENAVPNIFPPFPEREDFDIYASMSPAKEVGGDFYNFFLIDDEHLAFVIGDVSGKGVPAALFMMVTNIMISDHTRAGGTPGEILTAVNRDICAHNRADMFVTVWLGILDLATGRIVAANAGHDDAAICRKDGTFELFKTRHGFVAGGMDGVKYKDFEIRLEKGDKLFLYTDGVPEATDANNGMFGMERTLDTLNEHRKKTPQEILNGVHASVNAFVGDAPQFDDLTMLCVEYKG